MLQRYRYKSAIERALDRSPICALLGPRQCGKTTLARSLSKERPSHYFDLESPRDQLRLINAEQTLMDLSGLIILDEIQVKPELFSILRVLADRLEQKAVFLILGSASPELIQRSAESLAGRVEFIDLHGFDLNEVGADNLKQLWARGGFPKAFLAASDEDSFVWREGFVRTFLERDLPQFGVRVSSTVMRRFWTMLAHSHGQLWNASRLGRSMGLTDKTVRRYLEDLTQTYMIRQLQPWYENLSKRQVRAPKVFLRDSGILHHLLSLDSYETLLSHPHVGMSWEGFAMEQILRKTEKAEAYFWSTQSGAELDLLLFESGKRVGYEFKYSETPKISRSMRVAIEDLYLDKLYVVCPGDARSQLDEKVEVIGLQALFVEP